MIFSYFFFMGDYPPWGCVGVSHVESSVEIVWFTLFVYILPFVVIFQGFLSMYCLVGYSPFTMPQEGCVSCVQYIFSIVRRCCIDLILFPYRLPVFVPFVRRSFLAWPEELYIGIFYLLIIVFFPSMSLLLCAFVRFFPREGVFTHLIVSLFYGDCRCYGLWPLFLLYSN